MQGSVCLLRLTLAVSLCSAALPEHVSVAAGSRREPGGAVVADAQPAASRSGTSPTLGRARRPTVVLGSIVAPAAFPGLGGELARSLRTVLSDAGIDARAAASESAPASRSAFENTITGRIDDVGAGRLRLTLLWRNHSVQALGELERLDDLAYAAMEQLRPTLSAEASSAESPGPSERAAAPTELAGTGTAGTDSKIATATIPAGSEARKRPSVRPTAVSSPPAPGIAPAATTPNSKDKTKEPDSAPMRPLPATPPGPPASPSGPPPTHPVETPSPPPPQVVPIRPRIAVHVIGEPMSGLPPVFYGAGAIAQQTTIAYLQNRLHYPAVGSRLTGLVGGLDALTQSLRLGARHTLMARFDTLVDGFGSFGTRTVSGRLHIVLLLDGRPLLDRSLSIPPSAYYPTEPTTQVIARIVTAALDALSGELAARLGTPLPAQQ